MATPNLALPELVVGQDQAETTVNLALLELSILLQGLVLDRDLTAPPGSPVVGDTYIPLATATDEWTGHEDDIAWFDGSAWNFKTPNEGWELRVADENVRVEFDGAAWVEVAGGGSLTAVSSSTLGAPAASLTITGIDSTSRLWDVNFTKLQPVTDGSAAELDLRLGGSFPGDFLYEDHTQVSQTIQSSYAGNNGTGREFINIGGFNGQANDTNFAAAIQVRIPDPGTTDERKVVQYSGYTWTTAATPRIRMIHGRGAHTTNNGTLDAVRLTYSSGNIATGLVTDVYKHKNP